ncbi:MAG: GMC family oxidoreductase N-terminal domain-containing protein [Elusimicrobiota bacterium]
MQNEAVIVGAGVGGLAVAKELAHRGKKTVILEKGRHIKQFGNVDIIEAYDDSARRRSKEGVLIYSAFMVGGTGVVAIANGVRALEKELKNIGIDLTAEFDEVEKEVGLNPVPESKMGPRASKIISCGKKLGYNFIPMPKFIDFNKCVGCGKCVFGCAYGAKWSSLDYLPDMSEELVDLRTGITVEEVLFSGGKIEGVRCRGPEGTFEIMSDTVVLAAGGIGSCIILKKSGVDGVGENFFVDSYVNTYGSIEEEMKPELAMATVLVDYHEKDGFLLASFMPPLPRSIFMPPLTDDLKILKQSNSLGIMVKIKDEYIGTVSVDGKLEKGVTEKDKEKLDKGIEISKQILLETGCSEDSIFSTNVESAHPGGTAPMGKIVDTNLETDIKGLFICDASVLPETPGAPPILTITALGKRLGKYLDKKGIVNRGM